MKIGDLQGKWNIMEMENWDSDYFNMETQAKINFENENYGSFQFGLVEGNFIGQVYKYDNKEERFEFTWEGSEELDHVFGYGWIKRESIGILMGEFRIHGNENSKFEAVKEGYNMSLEVYNISNREERIQSIIGDEGMAVNTKTMKNYLNFLTKNIILPYVVTGRDSYFSYSEYGNKTPNGNDKFEIIEFESNVENYSNIFVKVKRMTSEGGIFSLQLSDFKSIRKDTIENKILKDYSFWIEKYL